MNAADWQYFLIQQYFPPDEVEAAWCITRHECSPTRDGYPGTCIGPEGYIDCSGRPTSDLRKSWGPFQIFDSCWNPDMNPASPFTREQWANVLDPNVNTWMASVIWSRSGWKMWSTHIYCPMAISTSGSNLRDEPIGEYTGVTGPPEPPPPPPACTCADGTRCPNNDPQQCAPVVEPPGPLPVQPASGITVLGAGLMVGALVLLLQSVRG